MTTPPPFADLEDLREHLRKTDITAEAEQLEMHLEAATEAVEGWRSIGPLVSRQFTERAAARLGHLILTKTPVQSVTSVTPVDGGTPLTVGDLDVDGNAGIVHGVPTGTYSVVYQAGRGSIDAVPVSLKLAVLIIAGHIWEIQRGPRSRNFHGQSSADESSGHKASAGYLIPNRAAHLMQPFANVPVA